MYPNDLYYRFLKEANQNPNYINKSLNKQYTEDIMGNHCFNPIQVSEVKSYTLNNKPGYYCEFVVTPIADYNYSYYHGIIRETNRYEYENTYSYFNSRFLEYVKTDDENDSVGNAIYDELPFNWQYRISITKNFIYYRI